MTAGLQKHDRHDHLCARPHSSFTSYSSDSLPPLPTRKSAADYFFPANLVVSRSWCTTTIRITSQSMRLCRQTAATTLGGCSPGAVNDGTYPQVWTDNLSIAAGITSKISRQITPSGPW